MGLVMPSLGSVCSARATRHANHCEAEDAGIIGSVAKEQAAKPPGPHFASGRKTI